MSIRNSLQYQPDEYRILIPTITTATLRLNLVNIVKSIVRHNIDITKALLQKKRKDVFEHHLGQMQVPDITHLNLGLAHDKKMNRPGDGGYEIILKT